MATRAHQFKDKGNTAFKAANYVDAIGYYTDAILTLPSEPTYFLNRAAAYLKLNKNEDAERDCTAALKLQPSNIKALYRRAQSRAALGLWNESISDFQEVLELDPFNLAAQSELQRAQSSKTTSPNTRTQPSLQQHRRRVPVAVLDDVQTKLFSQIPESSQVSFLRRRVPITIVDEKLESSEVSITDHRLIPTSNAQAQPNSTLKNVNSTFQQQSRAIEGLVGGDGISHNVSTVARVATASSPSDRRPTQSIEPPSNWNVAALMRCFSSVREPQMRWMAIQYVPPEKLPTFFAHSLSPEVLMQYIETFNSLLEGSCSEALRNDVHSYMMWFPSVQRFKTTILFLGNADKAKVQHVWDSIDADKVDAPLQATWGI